MPPKKSKGVKPKGGSALDDEDFDKILEAEIAANSALNSNSSVIKNDPLNDIANSQKTTTNITLPEAEDDDEDDDDNNITDGKKEKKKKKKKTKKDEVKKESSAPLSAAAQLILQQKQQRAEEEARLKKLQEEEDERVRLEEEREAAAKKAIEDEKERKRKAKHDKVDAQKAAGTYMTKAEKEKLKKAQARLESMKLAGGIKVPALDAKKSVDENHSDFKDKNGSSSKLDEDSKVTEINIEDQPTSISNELTSSTSMAEIHENEPETINNKDEVPDNWDDNEDDDNWESNKIIINLGTTSNSRTEDEDLIELEKKENHEKMRRLGLERARREEELRIKREDEERLRQEMEKKEREAAMRKENSRRQRLERDEKARAARRPDLLRSPISCIMGHVDTGKTKLLDKIRHTNVQEGEAGGITQQIGATQFSRETLQVQTQSMQKSQPFDIRIPGLLVIDTPGHESFTNLRSRGSSLCDIAILVIDLMHGLEPQTIESINLLKKKRTPFVVALNKVDRCYGWKVMKDSPIQEALAAQDDNCRSEFKDRSTSAITQLMEQGLNAKLYWENDDLNHTVSLVPTSAVTGEGVPDLLKMVITLTQERLQEQLMYMELLQCTVLEVKVIEGLGHTVDVILVNGTLHEGDTIVVSTMDGPVVTNIRALLTPPPNREMRVKSEYVHHQVLSGAIGVKIVAPDIGRAIAGTPVLVVSPEDDLEDIQEEVQSDLTKVIKSLQTDNRGVMVHASTLGALEALLQFLREECKPPIPVSYVNIGPIHKKDVMRASIMNEKKMPEFATILAFDVPIDSEAASSADELNVRIFSAEIIYHLFDQFTNFMKGIHDAKKQEAQAHVMFPCILKILPQFIFNKKDPIVLGVEVLEGTLRLNTLVCVPSLNLDIGRIASIQNNHKEVQSAKKSTSVSVRIVNEGNPNLTYGRQFDHTNALYSRLSRASIDALKDFYAEELTKDDIQLIAKLKKVFNIP